MVADRAALENLTLLRQAMREANVDICLIPSADPHLSEYLPEHWQIRRWLTGFTGSVGTVVVTAQDAHLWVDSRYWVQAEHELQGSGFSVQRMQSAADSGYIGWLAKAAHAGQRLAVDGRALSLLAHQALLDALTGRIHVELSLDLPGQIWSDRPGLPSQPIEVWSQAYAGQTRQVKLQNIRQEMMHRKVTHHFVSSLDDIAWILNLRGSDVPFNPVFLAHLIIDDSEAKLFVDRDKLRSEIVESLQGDGIGVLAYDHASVELDKLQLEDRLWVDPGKTACALLSDCKARLHREINPSTLLKACKTSSEVQNWREVMDADGTALCEFFAWLDQAIERRHEVRLTEFMLDEKVTAARARQAGFKGRSFATIAAFNANAAMPHYRATEAECAAIAGDGLLLIDSGAQYLGGTTDITRMVAVGSLSEEQKADCTLVLKAMIAMSRMRFPKGTMAPLLDAVARNVLWQQHIDYGHGTGHGVGYGLNVHEGPQVLSYKAIPNPNMALKVGMVTSNEPGLYRPGQWGVRIENLLCVQPSGDAGFGEFLQFETLTVCPIDLRCIDTDLLSPEDLQWLNDYHANVRLRLSDRLSGQALQWLLDRTQPLPL